MPDDPIDVVYTPSNSTCLFEIADNATSNGLQLIVTGEHNNLITENIAASEVDESILAPFLYLSGSNAICTRNESIPSNVSNRFGSKIVIHGAINTRVCENSIHYIGARYFVKSVRLIFNSSATSKLHLTLISIIITVMFYVFFSKSEWINGS